MNSKLMIATLLTVLMLATVAWTQEIHSTLQKGAIEILEKRTAVSKTYRNPDGSYTARISNTPIHYKDANGNWQEIRREKLETDDSLPGFADSPYQYIWNDGVYYSITFGVFALGNKPDPFHDKEIWYCQF